MRTQKQRPSLHGTSQQLEIFGNFLTFQLEGVVENGKVQWNVGTTKAETVKLSTMSLL